MNKKTKIIDLLCLISNGEEVPKKIKFKDNIYEYRGDDYCCIFQNSKELWLFSDGYTNKTMWLGEFLNYEVEILDDGEDKDIPLIPDDELWEIDGKKGIIEDAHTYSEISRDSAINRNFKVLKEKINQVAKEFNEYRKEKE